MADHRNEKLSDIREKLSDVKDRVIHPANEFYETATNWLEQGNNRYIALFGLCTVLGLAGFLIGRGTSGKNTGDSD